MNVQRLGIHEIAGLSWLFFCLLCRATESSGSVAPAKSVLELQERITRILTEHNVPGAGVAVVHRDGVVWATGIGKADVETGREVTPDTLFRNDRAAHLGLITTPNSDNLRM